VPQSSNEYLTRVIEALIFAAGRTVGADEIRESFESQSDNKGPSDETVKAAVASLNASYEETGRSFRVHAWAGGYRMATIPEFADYIRALFEEGPRRLTRSLMETLSVIAYRQPVSKPEVDDVRGVDSNYALRKLMELGFVAMTGRSETVGRPLLFGTTSRFLEDFGLNDLDELPQLREAEDLFRDDDMLAISSNESAVDLVAPIPPQLDHVSSQNIIAELPRAETTEPDEQTEEKE